MDIGILHSHTTVIILFLLFFLFKTILLLLDKIEQLEKIKAKTKVIDIVLGTLIVATGIYLLAKQEVFQTWLVVKLVIVFLAIPLGIIGLKKNKKALAILSLVGFIYAYGVSETKRPMMKPVAYTDPDLKVVGQKIYTTECARCHGEKGNANLYGSKDLIKTSLSIPERIEVIKKGRSMMPAYGTKFSEEQIKAVADYIEELKK